MSEQYINSIMHGATKTTKLFKADFHRSFSHSSILHFSPLRDNVNSQIYCTCTPQPSKVLEGQLDCISKTTPKDSTN